LFFCLAKPGLGGGSHDGDHILKAFAGTIRHLLGSCENGLHLLFGSVHHLTQIRESILCADGQLYRQGH
jgi:hypothetical protein